MSSDLNLVYNYVTSTIKRTEIGRSCTIHHIIFCKLGRSFSHVNFWIGTLQVLRDGVWSERDAEILVPGDIISIKLGDIIPADARLLEGDPLKIDQVLLGFIRQVCAISNC